jgi:hypothetical protein
MKAVAAEKIMRRLLLPRKILLVKMQKLLLEKMLQK